MDRGFCVNVISGKQFDVDETHPMHDELAKVDRTWWEMKPYMIQMPPATWAAYKAYINKVCKKYGGCDKVGSWDRTIQVIDEQLDKKGTTVLPVVP